MSCMNMFSWKTSLWVCDDISTSNGFIRDNDKFSTSLSNLFYFILNCKTQTLLITWSVNTAWLHCNASFYVKILFIFTWEERRDIDMYVLHVFEHKHKLIWHKFLLKDSLLSHFLSFLTVFNQSLTLLLFSFIFFIQNELNKCVSINSTNFFRQLNRKSFDRKI